MNMCFDMAINSDATYLYISQQGNQMYRISLTTWNVVTYGTTDGFVDGSLFYNAKFGLMAGIGIDNMNNLYLATNYAIRFISTSLSTVSTLAGEGNFAYDDGLGPQSSFYSPSDVETNSLGSMIFMVDYSNQCVRQISCTQGYSMSYGECISSYTSSMYVSTIIGTGLEMEQDGTGYGASFGSTQSLCLHTSAAYFITMKAHFHKVMISSFVTSTIASGNNYSRIY